MNYDDWKSTNPDDQYLGPEPDEQREDTIPLMMVAMSGAIVGFSVAQFSWNAIFTGLVVFFLLIAISVISEFFPVRRT